MRTTILLILCPLTFYAQTLLKMEEINGRQVLPCKVNGITMKFTIDTGENDAIISLTDAMFLLKNGYASASDLNGVEYDRFVYGHTGTGATLVIKQLVIGQTLINNVSATISSDLRTPLVVGQNVMRKLDKVEFDYSNQLVTIKGNKNDLTLPDYNKTAEVPKPVKNETLAPIPISNVSSPEHHQRLLVKTNTNLYALPNQGPAIHPVFSNTFVNLIGDAAPDQTYLYVDYNGKKGYINRLAVDTK